MEGAPRAARGEGAPAAADGFKAHREIVAQESPARARGEQCSARPPDEHAIYQSGLKLKGVAGGLQSAVGETCSPPDMSLLSTQKLCKKLYLTLHVSIKHSRALYKTIFDSLGMHKKIFFCGRTPPATPRIAIIGLEEVESWAIMYALGLHAEGQLLKAALLRREEKNQISVELVRTFDLQETKDALSALRPILADKKAILITGLDSWEILLREVHIKLKRKRELLSVLPFQSESIVPYPLEEAILVPFVHASGKEESDVTLFATKKESLTQHLERMAELRIDPDRVSAAPTALWRYARSYLAEESASILHLGWEKSCCLCFAKEKILFSQAFHFGVNQFFEALAEDAPGKSFDQIDCLRLDPEEFPKLSETLDKFNREWERLRAFFEKKGLPQTFSFLGDIPRPLRCLLEKDLNGEDRPDNGEHSAYAIPIGLALDAIHQDENSIQLRQNTFEQPGLFKKRMKHLAFCLLGISALTLATWGSSHLFLARKQSALIEKIELYRGEKIEPSREGLLQNVRAWSKSLSGKKVPFPYQLTAPLVSDFLGWVSTHPQLSQEGIEIKRIRYVLINYPTLGKTTLPYQVKVELEFYAASPTLARGFHDSLLKGEGIVNPEHEISWSVSENRYQTSFILRETCP